MEEVEEGNNEPRERQERGGPLEVWCLVHEQAVQYGDDVVVLNTVRVVGWSANRAMRNCVR